MAYYGNLAGLAAAFSWLATYADTAWLARLGITSVEDAAVLLLRVYWPLTGIALLAAILLPQVMQLALALDSRLGVRWPNLFVGAWPSLMRRFFTVLSYTVLVGLVLHACAVLPVLTATVAPHCSSILENAVTKWSHALGSTHQLTLPDVQSYAPPDTEPPLNVSVLTAAMAGIVEDAVTTAVYATFAAQAAARARVPTASSEGAEAEAAASSDAADAAANAARDTAHREVVTTVVLRREPQRGHVPVTRAPHQPPSWHRFPAHRHALSGWRSQLVLRPASCPCACSTSGRAQR